MHTFPHRTFAICKVPTVNPSGKNQRFLPAPTGREPLGAVSAAFRRTYYIFPLPYSLKKPGIFPAVHGWVPTTTSKHQPKSKPSAYPPAGSLRHLRCQLPPGGSYRLLPFHMGLYFCKVPAVNPSGKNQRFLPAPFNKGAFGCGIDGFPPNLLHIPSSLFPKKARYRYCGGNWCVDTLYQVPTQSKPSA